MHGGSYLPVTSAKRSGAARSPYVLVANRQSYLDLLVVLAVHGPVGVEDMPAVSWLPFVAPLLRRWGALPRSAADTAAAARAALGGTLGVPPLLSFPEARCTVGGCLVPFQRLTAFRAAVPVLPLVLRYETANSFNLAWTAPHHLVRPFVTGGAHSALTTASLGAAQAPHVFKMAAAWLKHVEVIVLPPHSPSAAECADGSRPTTTARTSSSGVELNLRGTSDVLFAQSVQAAVSKAAKLPVIGGSSATIQVREPTSLQMPRALTV